MTRPLLSVIVPIYNTEQYLHRCIDSILLQTYKKFEVILVDDGSADESGNICDEYAASNDNIHVVHKNNEGLILARFDGLTASQCKYVTFVDSDDWIDAELYEKLMMPLLADENIDISISPHDRVVGDKHTTHFISHASVVWNAKDAMMYMIEDKWFNWTLCGKIYKKTLFYSLQIDNTANPYGEDLAFNQKIFTKANKVIFQPIFGYHYYFNPNSIMNDRDKAKERLIFYDRIDDVFEHNNFNDTKIKKIAAKTALVKYMSDIIINFLMYAEASDDNIIAKYQKLLRKYYDYIDGDLTAAQTRLYRYGVLSVDDFHKTVRQKKQEMIKMCRSFCSGHQHLFIYGTGRIATETADKLDEEHIVYEGFITTDKTDSIFRGKRVYDLEEFCREKDSSARIITAMNEENTKEVTDYLYRLGMFAYIDAGQFSVDY